MRRSTKLLTGAFLLLAATDASAEGVIAGQATEVKKMERKLIGSAHYMPATDGRTFKVTARQTSLLIAHQLIHPESIVAMPEAEVVKGRRDFGTPIIVTSVPRGVEPVQVSILERNRALDAGTTANLFAAEPVTLASVQPGSPIAVVGGEPIIREDGYYVIASQNDEPALRSFRLTNGMWVTIADRVNRPAAITGDVAFDPKALEPGAYVRIVRREDGSHFLGTASAPRETYPGVPGGKVNTVDTRAQVIELSDGTMVHPVPKASAVLRVADQAADPSTIRPGTWVVIDPNPTLSVEAPAAIPADTVAAGRMLRILPAR